MFSLRTLGMETGWPGKPLPLPPPAEPRADWCVREAQILRSPQALVASCARGGAAHTVLVGIEVSLRVARPVSLVEGELRIRVACTPPFRLGYQAIEELRDGLHTCARALCVVRAQRLSAGVLHLLL